MRYASKQCLLYSISDDDDDDDDDNDDDDDDDDFGVLWLFQH